MLISLVVQRAYCSHVADEAIVLLLYPIRLLHQSASRTVK